MDSRALGELGRKSCEVGGAALAILAIKNYVLRLHHVTYISDWIWVACAALGASIVAIGLGCLVAASMLALGSSLTRVIELAAVGRTGRPYRFSFATAAELGLLHDFYSTFFKSDTPSLKLMQAWLEKCETAFVMQYDLTNPAHPCLVGSFKLLPLSKKGVRDLELGATSGSTFAPEHICSSLSHGVAFYIGDLCANGMDARSAIVAKLDATCLKLAGRGLPIYARPFTQHGRQVMSKRRFVHVSDGKNQLTMRQLCRMDPTAQGSLTSLMSGIRDARRRSRSQVN